VRTVTMPLTGDVAEVRTVRSRMRELLEADAWNESDVDAILLSASEMVNNAFAHARPPYLLQATLDDDALIEVSDGDGSCWPHLRPTPPSEPGGKGLWIVQALAAQWAAERRPGGKSVVARFERHADAQPEGGARGPDAGRWSDGRPPEPPPLRMGTGPDRR
jgi:anti-sigma regulatory factor (Ser/Thr protein kinase)